MKQTQIKQVRKQKTQPKNCNHIGIVQINPNTDSVILVCEKCGCIISKAGVF